MLFSNLSCYCLLCFSLFAGKSNAQILRDLYCFASFALSGFAPNDYDNYDQFFTDESIMQLGEAGTYTGAEAIEEYARFAGLRPESYTADKITIDQRTSLKTGSDPITGDCVLLFVTTYAYRTDPDSAIEDVIAVASFAKIFFEPNSLNSITINRANIYYGPDFLSFVFGSALSSDVTRTFVCTTMRDNCNDTFQLNEFNTIDDCVNSYAELPVTQDNNDVSGRSQGCKILHARFVIDNQFHCPHISVVPEIDENGDLKCQDPSQYEDPTNLFDEEDFEFFREISGNNGLGESGFKLCDCTGDDAGIVRNAFFRIFAPLWEIFNDLNPLPTLFPSFLPSPSCILCNQLGSG